MPTRTFRKGAAHVRKRKEYIVVYFEYDDGYYSGPTHIYRKQCPSPGCDRQTFPGRDWRGRWLPWEACRETCSERCSTRWQALNARRPCDLCKHEYIPGRDRFGKYRPPNGHENEEVCHARAITHCIGYRSFTDRDGCCSDACIEELEARLSEGILLGVPERLLAHTTCPKCKGATVRNTTANDKVSLECRTCAVLYYIGHFGDVDTGSLNQTTDQR